MGSGIGGGNGSPSSPSSGQDESLSSAGNKDLPACEALLANYVERLNAGEAISIDAIEQAHPEIAKELIDQLRLYQGAVRDPGIPASLGSLGDYTLRRQVGRGGMGIVYEAWEGSMDRRVALKILPAGVAADNKTFLRFLREARTAGQLSHPNVVPVYAMGVKDQVPYYAMEFVEGETLAQILAKPQAGEPGREAFLESSPGASPQNAEKLWSDGLRAKPAVREEDGLAHFAKLAEAFADVADGLQHAHSRGVIHRDIKPSNLILDRGTDPGGGFHGRLRILDFGLAHLEGQESLSASDSFIGTPLYMSPEQARARKIPVDRRTDIYSLGATLYEMLAGRPPFKGKDHQDTLSLIIGKDPEPLRRRRPRVPRDLETIVLKCLRKEPESRYATAEALAQDLRRFARGDPIEARPQNAWDRWAGRIRRHRRKALGAAILLFLALGGVIVASLLVWQEQKQTKAALDDASLQRRKAYRNFQKAREAVDLMLTEVSQETLESVPGMEDVRRSLLEKASGFYQGFLAESGGDADLRRETGRAALRLGDIFLKLGRHSEAEQACRQAMAAFGALSSDAPGDPEPRHDLARSHLRLGEILSDTGRNEEAMSSLEISRSILERLAAEFPDLPAGAEDLASSEDRRGRLLQEMGNHAEAERCYRRAAEIQGRLIEKAPGSAKRLEALSSSLARLASVLQATRDLAGAEETYRRALSLWDSAGEADREKPEHLAQVSAIRHVLALLLRDTGRGREAEATIREVLGVYRKLAAEAPLVPEYQVKLSRAYADLANITESTERAGEARQEALAISRKLVATYPHVVSYRFSLAADLGNLGNWLRGQGRDPTRAYREGMEVLEEVVRRSPESHRYQNSLAMTRSNLACYWFARSENLDEALDQLRQARDALRELRRSFPAVHEYHANLARTSNNLGLVLEAKERYREAEEAYREAVNVQEDMVKRFPSLRAYRDVLARNLLNLGSLLAKTRNFSEAESSLGRAVAKRRELLEEDPGSPGPRHDLAIVLEEAGNTSSLAGKAAEAQASWEECAAIRRKLAQEFPEKSDHRSGLAFVLFKLAISTCRSGEKQRARPLYDEAIKVMETLAKPEANLEALREQAREALGEPATEKPTGT